MLSRLRSRTARKRLAIATVASVVLTMLGCSSDKPGVPDAATPGMDAGTDAKPDAGVPVVDPNLPAEPMIPPACATLDAPHAVKATGNAMTDGLPVYDPAALDTDAIQAKIEDCAHNLTAGQKGSVRLRVNATDATKVAFVSGPLFLRAGVTLWIDRGVTLFAAQDPRKYDTTPGTATCGTDANNNSGGCLSLINAKGDSATALLDNAGVMGDGVIDGLGGEPMIGGFNGNPNGTWWDVAQHAKQPAVSHSNPRLIDILLSNHFTLYRVTLRNSPKFHVGLESDNYLVWGVTVQTPSRAVNSVGRKLTASYARNTDGIDPSDSWNGVIAYSRISVGDDQIAIKCGKYHMNTSANAADPSCRNLIVAHTQFGTGHGMSIGSETNGGHSDNLGIGMSGVLNSDQSIAQWGLHVYDLTIDGSVGTGGADDVDINGIRIKSDPSRGGLVKDVLYEDVCLRNLPNPIVINPHYDPTKTGIRYPTYQNIILRNVHAVPSTAGAAPPAVPVVSLLGLDDAHRTTATLDNVVIDGIDSTAGVVGQFADLKIGPGPVNFTPRDTLSTSGTPGTVTVTPVSGPSASPVPCGDRFTVSFPDLGNEVSRDNNASLRQLAVTADGAPAGLSPAFASGITSYAVTVPNLVQTVVLTPSASAARARSVTVTQDGTLIPLQSGSATLVVPALGATSEVTVIVTAEDAATTMSYTIHLTRVAPGADATLGALVDSAGALHFDPASAEHRYSYAVPVALSVGYTVTPTVHDPHASIRVNGGAPVASGTAVPVALSPDAATTVSIVVTAEDGTTTVTYTLEITVDQAAVPATGIALSQSSLRLDTFARLTGALIASVLPANATDRVVSWSSSAPSVASVDATGMVTALSAGTATITATSHDGGFQASCTIRVFSLMFGDDFEAGSGAWDLTALSGGAFSIATDGTSVLKYAAGTAGGVIGLVKDTAWAGVTTGDYYVEARIKPQTNSNTGNKFLYLIARYQDPTNWYAAGLNVQSATAATKVEIAKMSNGALSRPLQINKPIVMDTTWYTVRFELVGSTLSVYLDGELMSRTVTDPSFASGKIGLYTANKSFEIDDVRVGDPIDRPVQLTVSPNTDWAAEAGDAPRLITVTAQKPDYASGSYLPDSFTVSSSDPTVVSASVTGTAVTLTPLKAGTATITFTSGSDPSLTRAVTATISPPFVQSTTVYNLTGRTTPAAAELAVYADTRLTISFDAPPTLGTAGSVRIFRKSDDALVDVIKPRAEIDAIGFPGQGQVRVVNVEGLITIAGNTATITPHHARLDYGTEYYVAIAGSVLAGTTLGGTAFDGIGKAGNWSFTTRSAPAANLTSLVVDDDGPADFRTVQGALDHVMKNVAVNDAVTVHVRNGTYQELLYLRGKNNINIVGESRDGVIIQYRNYDTLNTGSGASQAPGSGSPGGGRALFLIETSDLVTLDTLTLRNTMLRSTTASSQAETVYFNNDTGRLIAKNATFLSEQDTVQLKGYAWFFNTLIAGNVDFIWGNNRVAVFEDSEIRSVGDTTSATAGGYVVQARTVAAMDKGFVFLHSRLTHGPGPGPSAGDVPPATTYLARSPGGAASFDNVAFINCQMDAHVIPVGWAYNVAGQPPSNPPIATAASGWREYGTTDLNGVPVDLTARVGGDILTDGEFASGFATRAQIFAAFGGGTGWNPQP